MQDNKQPKKKKKSFLSLLFGNLFHRGGAAEDLMQEEQIRGPWRTVMKNFCSNKVSMIALIVFIVIFLFVIIAPMFFPMDLSYVESSQQNMKPGQNLMRIPSGLDGKVQSIGVGPKFSVGISTEGKVYVWGQPRISNTISMNTVGAIDGTPASVAVGTDHALILTKEGKVHAWGNNRLQQCTLPADIYKHGNITQVVAGYQISVAVTDKGEAVVWGNTSLNDAYIKKTAQGNIKKVVATGDALIGLTLDGNVVYLGKQMTAYSSIPEGLAESGNVIDIAATGSTVAAVTADGQIVVWGNTNEGEGKVPEVKTPIIALDAGRFHYVALCENGDVLSWGGNMYHQTEAPKDLKGADIRDIYVGAFQNYAVMNDGTVETWGLKGYVLGTDDLGRDILTRLVNGGKMTMSIGAVSVIIATVIGVVVGCIAGFFGGKVDMFLMRVAEIFSAMPFLPFAMILSAILVNVIGEDQRIFIIMVILGLLSWTGLARLVRAQVLSQREQEFVTAAKAMGIRERNIVFKHILPNVISTIIVNATLAFATCLLTESSLSYLGFGVTRPRPTWGNMLYGANNSVTIQNYWWIWVFPALILSICVICINTVGDGLRDAMDPRSNER